MPLSKSQARLVHESVAVVCEHLAYSTKATRAWRTLSEDELCFELGSCILGSRVSYETATAAARSLQRSRLLPARSVNDTRSFNEYETACMAILREPLLTSHGTYARYPFPGLRASHLRRAFEAVSNSFGTLHAMLCSFGSVWEARAELARSVTGVGPKQASLFLRNVGYTDDVAILDSHVLRYMEWMGLSSGGPQQPRGLTEYEDAEATFRDHARGIGYSVGHVDCAVWIVSRVAVKEKLI